MIVLTAALISVLMIAPAKATTVTPEVPFNANVPYFPQTQPFAAALPSGLALGWGNTLQVVDEAGSAVGGASDFTDCAAASFNQGMLTVCRNGTSTHVSRLNTLGEVVRSVNLPVSPHGFAATRDDAVWCVAIAGDSKVELFVLDDELHTLRHSSYFDIARGLSDLEIVATSDRYLLTWGDHIICRMECPDESQLHLASISKHLDDPFDRPLDWAGLAPRIACTPFRCALVWYPTGFHVPQPSDSALITELDARGNPIGLAAHISLHSQDVALRADGGSLILAWSEPTGGVPELKMARLESSAPITDSSLYERRVTLANADVPRIYENTIDLAPLADGRTLITYLREGSSGNLRVPVFRIADDRDSRLPEIPLDLSATLSRDDVLLQWKNVPSAGATGVQIEYSTEGDTTWHAVGTVGPTAAAATIYDLQRRMNYSFRVRSFNTKHISAPSNVAHVWISPVRRRPIRP